MARAGSRPPRPYRGNNTARNDYNGGGDRDRNYDRPSGSRYDGGRNDSDNWRRSDDRRDDDRGGSYNNDYQRGGDSYRPRPPQGDFTFRFDKPAGVGESGAHHHHGGERRGPRRDRGGHFRGKPRWKPPPHPSERALVSGLTRNLPEERLNAGDGTAKYRDIDDLSDDDEQDMEISPPDSPAAQDASATPTKGSDTEEPSRKRTRTDGPGSESGNAVPRWSNPDPYTALPCPDAGDRKKKDMVKLIRKARVEESVAKPAATSQAENFISFDSSEDEKDAEESDEYEPEPPKPALNGSTLPPPPRGLPPPPPRDLPPPPPLPERAGYGTERRDATGPLGTRKRTVDDEIKPPDYGYGRKAPLKPGKGNVVAEWKAKDHEDPCPWFCFDHSATYNMAFRLHKEIADFFEYVRPRHFEHVMRGAVVDNLERAMKRDGRNFATAKVRAFGSFMSGLYLPTSDLDLVVTSAAFESERRIPVYLGAKSWLYKFSKMLTAQRVAEEGTITVIAHARVPLVKFVDKNTGLKIDISFENLGGVDAIKTFLRWKDQYPAMPILATLIKHYLTMRGLNDPATGGIGGFSIVCLVVSMLQLMPQVQSRSLIPEHHLGEMLLEFFDLYGNQFDYETSAISLTGPKGYIRKNDVPGFVYRSKDRLSIIDPNNDANDIAGGSSNIQVIVSRFQEAHRLLRERMNQVANSRSSAGILDVILAGDYSSFRKQRNYLEHVHKKTIGPCNYYCI